jgi:phosphomannomutase
MNITDKNLIIFDLDGTLTPSKSPMSPEMGALLGRLLAQKKVAVISGGSYPQFLSEFLTALPTKADGLANLYLVPTSGTRLFTWKGTWTEEYAENFTKEEKVAIMAAFKSALTAAGYEEPAKTYGPVIEDRESQITFSALGQAAPIAVKQGWDPDHSKRDRIVAGMVPKLPTFDVRIGGTTSIDVTKRGVNKAYGIHKLEQYLKIPIDKMLFIGDALFYGGNDYPAKTTGVDCIQVSGPEETQKLIEGWVG